VNSSWIDSTLYKSFPDGSSYLAIFLKPGHGSQVLNEGGVLARQDVPTALLYGPKVPSYFPGLVAAGTGRRSVGLAFNRLVKGKYTYQRVEGKEKVEQLKEMMS
jgi:hypothetical protein